MGTRPHSQTWKENQAGRKEKRTRRAKKGVKSTQKTNPNPYYLGVPFDDPSAGKFSHLASPSSIQVCGTILNLFL